MLREARTITSRAQLETVFRHIAKLAYPYVLEWRDVRRTDAQNDLMWPLLQCFAEQTELSGKRLTKEQWKCVMMHALGHEVEVLPTLDGKSWFPAGFRSSRLSKSEFSDLLELIYKEAAERGVVWKKEEA